MNDELKEQLDHFLALMSTHDLLELEIARDGFKVRLKKKYEPVRTPVVAVSGLTSLPIAAAVDANGTGAAVGAPAVEPGLREIKSPMVGTFYSAPSPEAAAYVEVGATVTEESVVCCIEAMKVFNEIKAECEGAIVQVLADNGQVVEYGQPLFIVRESDG